MANGSPKIKVCGMRNTQNIGDLLKLKPDYLGFILYPPSKRYVGEDYKLEIDIPKSTQRVGVFVNELIATVFSWVNRLELDYVQIHGDESAEYCMELSKMKIKVIKSFGIDENFNFDALEAYMPWCDYFLFDTKSKDYGGTGLHFDWNLLNRYTYSKPVFMSGGIGPEDITQIGQIQHLPIHAIDINSKFELSPAMKNIDLLKNFISAFRATNNEEK